jgi:hypothetical protein
VLAEARRTGRPPGEVAHALADAALVEPHPTLGHRGRAIVASLVSDRWASAVARG